MHHKTFWFYLYFILFISNGWTSDITSTGWESILVQNDAEYEKIIPITTSEQKASLSDIKKVLPILLTDIKYDDFDRPYSTFATEQKTLIGQPYLLKKEASYVTTVWNLPEKEKGVKKSAKTKVEASTKTTLHTTDEKDKTTESTRTFMEDRRIKCPQNIFPFNIVGRLVMKYKGQSWLGTATLMMTKYYHDHTFVLTAAHNVYPYPNKKAIKPAFPDRIYFYPENTSSPKEEVMEFAVAQACIPKKWYDNKGIDAEEVDYCVLKLAQKHVLHPHARLQLYKFQESKDMRGLSTDTYRVIGYPGDEKKLGDIYSDCGPLTVSQKGHEQFLLYDIDTSGGQSGSAVSKFMLKNGKGLSDYKLEEEYKHFKKSESKIVPEDISKIIRDIKEHLQFHIMGIHTNGRGGIGKTYTKEGLNSGVRIDEINIQHIAQFVDSMQVKPSLRSIFSVSASYLLDRVKKKIQDVYTNLFFEAKKDFYSEKYSERDAEEAYRSDVLTDYAPNFDSIPPSINLLEIVGQLIKDKVNKKYIKDILEAGKIDISELKEVYKTLEEYEHPDKILTKRKKDKNTSLTPQKKRK